eukprot:CAMPEP_0194574548 /NCGR_PEP_ID=MMETSP0292-20121207/10355_1 /TAXON_ID=39354 /ORGANISM="Heterosigma akashiwo, Strain CCMP2393" /LENGTH=80 /DNA_ID=CAMNT_0039426091 /DNA_START=352 /DNA_END=595 /DNA_ORIENTATION=+
MQSLPADQIEQGLKFRPADGAAVHVAGAARAHGQVAARQERDVLRVGEAGDALRAGRVREAVQVAREVDGPAAAAAAAAW